MTSLLTFCSWAFAATAAVARMHTPIIRFLRFIISLPFSVPDLCCLPLRPASEHNSQSATAVLPTKFPEMTAWDSSLRLFSRTASRRSAPTASNWKDSRGELGHHSARAPLRQNHPLFQPVHDTEDSRQ